MFTGIITHLGKLKKRKDSIFVFSTKSDFLKQLKKGDSVAVNGVCLTLISPPKKNSFCVEVMPETLKRTNLGDLKIGDYVNLELPLRPNTFLSGHFVQGHVDGKGTICDIKKEKNSWIFKFKAKREILKYLVQKGSVAVNGISLTVIDVKKDFFTVGIIPHTWKNTQLQFSKIGDKVNIEVDIISKYLYKFLKGFFREKKEI